MLYKCPKGHEVTAKEHEPPQCRQCGIGATWWNAGTGEVYQWWSVAEIEAGRERMQDMLDDAFCNQYFPDW